MTTVAAEQAGKEFAQLLQKASQGEVILITDGGTPVAKLVPVQEPPVPKFPVSLEELREWRRGNILGPDLTVDQLIAEGRRP